MEWGPDRPPPWLCWLMEGSPSPASRRSGPKFAKRRGLWGAIRHVPVPRRLPAATATRFVLGGKLGAVGWTMLCVSSVLFWTCAMNSEYASADAPS